MTKGARIAGVLAAVVALVAPTGASARTPQSGVYKATTTQCGSAASTHPCYAFRFKLAKGRCAPPGGHTARKGLCVTFIGVASVLTPVDVTCPDGKAFASQLLGPGIPVLLGSSGSARWSGRGGIDEDGTEIVTERESLSLSLSGSKGHGTLTLLTQENIGNEPPTCKSGTVSFTAKRV